MRRALVVFAWAGLAGLSVSGSGREVLDVAGPIRSTQSAPSPGCLPTAVVAPISDPFRPPPEPWLAGNRGVTFATVPGQEVHVVLPGVVTFAGAIARQRYVTVRLADGRRTTYSYLATVAVRKGAFVSSGELLGRTGTKPFQLGLVSGDAYLDPTPLVRAACARGHAVLVAVPRSH